MLLLLRRALLFLFACSFAVGETGEELATSYRNILLNYDVFPPTSDDPAIWEDESIKPIEVVIGVSLVSIDTISPGDSEFTLTTRSILYWKKSECNQTETHEMACSKRLQGGNGMRFLQSMQTKGTPRASLSLFVEDAHNVAFTNQGKEEDQPDMEIYQIQTTMSQSFDLRNYPYEYHELRVAVTSVYTENVVKLTDIGADTGVLNPSVPAGWNFHGVSCSVEKTTEGRAITKESGSELSFDSYECVIKVSRKNTSWWLSSFFLAAGICTLAVVGNLGIMSRNAAEARDDKDAVRRELYNGTRLMGTFTVGLLLTYVFQVEDSPYGRPMEYWPSIPTSSMIYMVGMFYIIIQSMAGLIASIFVPNPLAREGFVGQIGKAYDVPKLPVEGNVGEDAQPLLLKKYNPEGEEEKDTAVEPTKLVLPEANESPFEPIPNHRRNNQRQYNVLSVEEAHLVNTFVKRIFWFKFSMILIVVICTIAILGSASARHNKLVG